MNKHTEQRIKRRSNNGTVIQLSTPIVFFGNIKKSRIATLGINPSKNEFLDKGIELTGNSRRFETLTSLGATDLELLNDSQVEKVVESCLSYFNNNPYRKWFDQLQNFILNNFSVSYYLETACHLDIVQWATDPIWRDLDYFTKSELIQNDIKFLKEQLLHEQIEVLLINGREASNLFQNYFKPILLKHERLVVKNKTCDMYFSELELGNRTLKIFSWSNNLQSSIGITNEMRKEIGYWIKEKSIANII
ncbi:hypothetical protein [Rufibacter hautae]|uniref:Uncharacterized protein n=1 Tax=Rufibacter hautae TaxID=2595005 RepID=A0A5B6T885_9BACT|nr:hypothetical protein [Rufibacter hautae]KAA3436368.1 hypothetical protein FOA19_18410 [Rufibacter hautae]